MAEKLTKKHLLEMVCDKSGIAKKDVEMVLESYHAALVQAMKDGKVVTYPGFGTYQVKDRAARMGRNPATGEPLQIKASKNIGFKVAKSVKEDLLK